MTDPLEARCAVRTGWPWRGSACAAALALATALLIAAPGTGVGVGVATAASDASEGPILGLDGVDEPLPWFDDRKRYPTYDGSIRGKRADAVTAVTSRGQPPMDEPVSVRLSRYEYPAEDEHLDVVVRFDVPMHLDPPAAGREPVPGELEVRLVDAAGGTVSEQTIEPIPGKQLHFSYAFPESLHGESGELRVRWVREDEDDAEAVAAFNINEPADLERSGRVRIDVPNDSGATIGHAPMSAGVPFPRGVLQDTDNLRLVDAGGNEVPLQVTEKARWSRFGSIRWVMCDFTADLAGEGTTFHLEYGPDVSRSQRDALTTGTGERTFADLAVDAGRLRIDDGGLAYDFTGEGDYRTILEPEAMIGAFVEHVDAMQSQYGNLTPGKSFTMLPDHRFSIEEAGPEKLVLRAEGWFEHAESGDRYCKFVNRYVIHRDSPVVRVFHTWIFTGDGNQDAIRNMGWRLPVRDLQPLGFLHDFAEGEWVDGGYKQQHDHDAYTIFEITDRTPRVAQRMPERLLSEHARPLNEMETGEHATGIMAAAGDDGARLYVGVQDFRQNFPSSLKVQDDALTFYQWPRWGRTRENFLGGEDSGLAWRLPFVHEGETLTFRLPDPFVTGGIYHDHSRGEPHWQYGRADSLNAQGIAKTAELWLYLADEDADTDAVRVLEGLRDETLRAIVDPNWIAESGAMYNIAARDEETYPEHEQAYELLLQAVQSKVEHMGVYGKWIYGDLLRTANLETGTAAPYRVFRKAHWGWPYSWVPFARSGDTTHLRFAQAATRMMSDTAYVHYVSDDIAEQFADLPERRMWDFKQPFRQKGWHNRNLVPWAGYWGPTVRCYVDQADYLWHAYYLTGYHRAKDVALDWAEQTKREEPFTLETEQMGRGPITSAYNRARWSANLAKQYTEMYEATWDPWFLEAAHAIADMHIWRHHEEDWNGHFWHGGYQTYQRYTGRPDHAEFVEASAYARNDWHASGWATSPSTEIPTAIFGYKLTGDEYFLRRLAGILDLANFSAYQGEPWYYQGIYARATTSAHLVFTSWYQKWFPEAMGLLREAGMPEHPLPMAFSQVLGDSIVAVRKEANEPLTLRTQGSYTITDPTGDTVDEGDADEVTLDADLPAGTYRVDLGSSSVTIPITAPGNEEVMILGDEREVPSTRANFSQHWFYVPEGVESFWIEFDNPGFWRQSQRQHVIWDSDGNEAWAHRQIERDHDPDQETIRAEVEVSAEQAGRLWRVTLPGQRAVALRFDPQLSRRLAHDPTRWFEVE